MKRYAALVLIILFLAPSLFSQDKPVDVPKGGQYVIVRISAKIVDQNANPIIFINSNHVTTYGKAIVAEYTLSNMKISINLTPVQEKDASYAVITGVITVKTTEGMKEKPFEAKLLWNGSEPILFFPIGGPAEKKPSADIQENPKKSYYPVIEIIMLPVETVEGSK